MCVWGKYFSHLVKMSNLDRIPSAFIEGFCTILRLVLIKGYASQTFFRRPWNTVFSAKDRLSGRAICPSDMLHTGSSENHVGGHASGISGWILYFSEWSSCGVHRVSFPWLRKKPAVHPRKESGCWKQPLFFVSNLRGTFTQNVLDIVQICRDISAVRFHRMVCKTT